jgi:hypothetical protein
MTPIDRTQLDVSYGDGVWTDLPTIDFTGSIIRTVFLPFGTSRGNPSIEILIQLGDGHIRHERHTVTS